MVYKDIIFPLLREKMAEDNIDIKKIANDLSLNRATLVKWFSGLSEPKLVTCRRIRDKYFPDQKIEDLFDPNKKIRNRENEKYQFAPSKIEYFDSIMSSEDDFYDKEI